MWVRPLSDSDASCGGKAVGLAKLLDAGLPVPEGYVLTDAAFRIAAGAIATDDPATLGHELAAAADRIATVALPDDLVAEVDAVARALGPLAVRSSATIEDGESGAAAGVFSSRIAVTPDDVWPAIRAVWASALTPLAAAYARRRGHAPPQIGVILQRYLPGERVTIYTRPPGAPTADELWEQRAGKVTRLPRSGERLALAVQVEEAIGATGGADIELVGDSIVQARPIVHPTVAPRVPPPPTVLAPLTDGRTWTWDVTHNPDPLSPAQTELVARVERAGVAPWSLRVCGGYLYASPREQPDPPPLDRLAAIEAALAAALGTDEPASLDDAIDRYVAFYRIWATELSPLIAAARRGAPPDPGHRPSAVEATLLAAARGEITEATAIARLGVLAPAWDVAVPTFAERPGLVRDAIARARSIAVPPARVDAHDLAADLAERDDLWFARAQWLVRRTILALARARAIDPEDACWLAPDELASLDPTAAARRASGARAAAERAAAWAMPIVVGDREQPVGSPPLHGHGVGVAAAVTGRVVRFASLARAIVVGRGDVIVTRAVTPALAVFVVGCAALVSETGGPLDHGAALARELGIPCVVGCRDAWLLLSDGMMVTVDGNAGTVTTLS